MAKVFPVNTDMQMSDAVTLITPCLSQTTCNEFRDTAAWLSTENIEKIDSITHFNLECFNEHEKIVTHQRNVL